MAALDGLFKGDLRDFNIVTIVIIYRTNKKPIQGKCKSQRVKRNILYT